MSMAEPESEVYYRVQYKQQGSEHPFNYWLGFGRDSGYQSHSKAMDLINDLGQRMAVAYDYPLIFRILEIETIVLEEHTLVP